MTTMETGKDARSIEAMLDELKPIKDAIRISFAARMAVVDVSNFGWNKIDHAMLYLQIQANDLEAEIAAYFSDTEAVNV